MRVLFGITMVFLISGFVWYLIRLNTLDPGESGSQVNVASLFVRKSLKEPLRRFRDDVGRYPTTEEGLLGLIHCPEGESNVWMGPYIDPQYPAPPIDPWGRPYEYRSPGLWNRDSYDVWSLGPDGVQSGDDLANWRN